MIHNDIAEIQADPDTIMESAQATCMASSNDFIPNESHNSDANVGSNQTGADINATAAEPLPSDTTMETSMAEAVAEQEAQNLDENNQQSCYYVYDLSVPYTVLGTTHTRYNRSTKETLQSEASIVQQSINFSRIQNANNYFRNAKWAPDGSCLLTNSNDDVVRLFNLPSNVYDEQVNEPLDLAPVFGIREGESIYDMAWFPSMNSQDTATCCFLTSVRDHPVRLWDVHTGAVRATYSVIDHQERFIGPNVVTFNLDGSRIYCGYENMIEIFDVHRPGQHSTKIPTVPTRKSRKGQKGIISCIDFSPIYDGLYAAGSYSQSVGIYDESSHELALKLTGIQGGVTQVKFSVDGQFLFTASRVSDSILCWDIRNTENILYELPRQARTNQRITFDIDPSGRILVTGNKDGCVSFFDIASGTQTEDHGKDRLLQSYKMHQDVASCATFNPVYPVIATVSGQRKFSSLADSSDDESSDTIQQVDNSLKISKIHGKYEWYTPEVLENV